MDDLKPNTLSPAEAEEFWAGEDARTGVSGAEPEEPNSLTLTPLDIARLRAAFAAHEDKQHCCAGVDVPEAGGRVHAADCPHRTSPSRSGGECGAGAAPRLRESAGVVGNEESGAVGLWGGLTQADGSGAGDSLLRCRHCGNLRHAAPKHQPWCRYAVANCPGCVYEGAAHIASCPRAVTLTGDFGEPWTESKFSGSLRNRNDIKIYHAVGTGIPLLERARYLRRVAACVNFCAGVATADLEGRRLIDYRTGGAR